MPLTDRDHDAIDRVAGLLKPEQTILFITGAGLSADSGLPTYRGIGGLYDGGLGTTHGVPIETALSGVMMARRPEVTWAYLHELEQASRGATFNRGHQVIAEMERAFKSVWVLTQNVDGFHRAAGSNRVIDIHGDLHDLVCTRCGDLETVSTYEYLGTPPRCLHCHGVIRPDVVLFGEALPDAEVDTLRTLLADGVDLVFSVGTSSLFPYIAEPVVVAKAGGIPTVEINPGETGVSDLVDIRIKGRAADVLDAVWDRYQTCSSKRL